MNDYKHHLISSSILGIGLLLLPFLNLFLSKTIAKQSITAMNSEWNIQFSQSSLDCSSNQVCYQIELESVSGTTWTIGDQNYRLFYDGDLMTITSVNSLLPSTFYSSANIDQNIKISGQGQEAASPLDNIDDNLGFLDFSIVQTDKSNPTAATLIGTTFTPIAEICVDIDNSVITDYTGGTCLSFYQSRPETAGTITNQYTVITENDVPGNTIATSANEYHDLTEADGADACLGLTCTPLKEWNIQLNQISQNCSTGEVCYYVELQGAVAANWTIGDQNYRFFYDGDLMTITDVTSLLPISFYSPANIDQNIKVSGQGQEASSPLNDIDDNLGFLDFSIIQTDKSNPTAATIISANSFTPIAGICVQVDMTIFNGSINNNCLSIYHSRPSTAGTFTNQYTVIVENNVSGNTIPTNSANYDDQTNGFCSADCANCNNITDAGIIADDESNCANYNPSLITSLTLASGGIGGSIEYIWQKSIDNTTWVNMLATNTSIFNPPSIAITTYFRRGAKYTNCTDWVYSNVVTKSIENNVTNAGSIAESELSDIAFDPNLMTNQISASGGIGLIEYRWQSSPGGNIWTVIAGATNETYDPSFINETTYYRRQAKSDICIASPANCCGDKAVWLNSNVVVKGIR